MNPVFLIFLFFISVIGNAQTTNSNNPKPKIVKLKLESGIEYLTPISRDRSIQTISGNLLFGAEFFKKTPLSVYGGITATYAWGTIIQWDENFNDVKYKNNAMGIGPAFLLRFEPFVYHGFSISPDFGGALIFYSNRFPHGGDIYNFMWRMGGAVHYRINQKFAVNINAKWMHVSNGQGLGPQNPSYEAWGLGLAFVNYFK